MKRKLRIILAAVALLAVLWCGGAMADKIAEGSCGENITWFINDNGYMHIQGSGEMDDYSDEYPGFYEYRNQIKAIIIYTYPSSDGSGVTSIGNFAFYNLDKVEKVLIHGNGLQTIGHRAFMNCSGINQTVDIPISVTTIGYGAFQNCSSLPNVGFFNPNISFDNNVFEGCSDSLSISGWPDSTTKAYALKKGLAFDELPDCGYCGSNAIWTILPEERKLMIVGNGEMKQYASEKAVPWYRTRNVINTVVIEDGVESIGDHAFHDCTYLTDITIPTSVTSIGERSFYSTALSGIAFPDSISYIGTEAFRNCQSLVTVTLPHSVTYLDDGAFSYCYKLKKVFFYRSDMGYGNNVFKSALANPILCGWPDSTAKACAQENKFSFYTLSPPEPTFFLPAGVTSVWEGAFSGIGAESVVIPENVTDFPDNPFAGSSIICIYGYADSPAETLALDCGYYFVPIDDNWMASHKP